MQKSTKQMVISLAAGTAFALAPAAPTHEAPSLPRAVSFAETSQSPNVRALATAIVGLCNVDKTGGVTLVDGGLQCTVPLAAGGAISLEASSATGDSKGYPNLAFLANVSVAEANDSAGGNQTITYFSPTQAGVWNNIESAQGYDGAAEIAGQATLWSVDAKGVLSSPDGDSGVVEAAWDDAWDDAVAELAQAKNALGDAAAAVPVPAAITMPTFCSPQAPCE